MHLSDCLQSSVRDELGRFMLRVYMRENPLFALLSCILAPPAASVLLTPLQFPLVTIHNGPGTLAMLLYASEPGLSMP